MAVRKICAKHLQAHGSHMTNRYDIDEDTPYWIWVDISKRYNYGEEIWQEDRFAPNIYKAAI